MITLASVLYADRGRGRLDLEKKLERELRSSRKHTAKITFAHSDVATAILRALDTPVADMAERAWSTSERVRRACHDTADRPGVREVIRLLEHAAQSEELIDVELESSGARYRLVTLTLRLEVEANAVDVIVEEGRVVQLVPGSACVTVSLLLAGRQLVTGSVSDVNLVAHPQAIRTP